MVSMKLGIDSWLLRQINGVIQESLRGIINDPVKAYSDFAMILKEIDKLWRFR